MASIVAFEQLFTSTLSVNFNYWQDVCQEALLPNTSPSPMSQSRRICHTGAFFAEAEGEMKQRRHTRRTGERNSQKAHKEYLHISMQIEASKISTKPNRPSKEKLEFGRRWSILVDGYDVMSARTMRWYLGSDQESCFSVGLL